MLPVSTNFAALNPEANGARVVIRNVTGTVRVDVTLPGGTYAGAGTRGGTLNGSGTKWTFKDKTGSPVNGITKMLIQDRNSQAARQVKVFVKGKDGSYPVLAADAPVMVSFTLGGQSASETGQCGESVFVAQDCGFSGSGNKLTCQP